MRLRLDRLPSPLGGILLVTDADGVLRALDFHDFEPRMHSLLERHYGHVPLDQHPGPPAVTGPLRAYFAGDLAAPERIPVRTAGTDFQRRVWAALRTIPAGRTVTYGALAARLGSPRAARATGRANGANPIAIVVPCHRVIGADATLTGFGGGLPRKRWLLDHEARHQQNP